MRTRRWRWAAALLLAVAAAVPLAGAATLPADYRIEPVVRGLDHPRDLAVLPDGRLLVAERLAGDLRVVEQGELRAEPLVHVDVAQGAEEGLLGVAVDPDFASEGWVYLYYTQADPRTNRVERFWVSGSGWTRREVVVDDLGAAPGATENGGGLGFGPDGLLYVGVGVMGDDASASDPAALGGKVLRMLPDGGVPSDNPFPDRSYPYNLVWAEGLRDVRAVVPHPDVATLYGTDAYGADASCDETNVLRAGATYGWDAAACSAGSGTLPLHAIEPQIDVTDLAPYTADRYPLVDDLFVAGAADDILRDELTGAELDTLGASHPFYAPVEAVCPRTIMALAQGADGWLYVLSDDADTADAGLYRVIYDPDGGAEAFPRAVSDTPHIPLRVERASGGLELYWEDLKREAWTCTPDQCPVGAAAGLYAIWQGELTAPFAYAHTITAETDGIEHSDALIQHTLSPMPEGNAYFLVSARGSNLEGPTGTDSEGLARPGVSGADEDFCNTIGHGPTLGLCSNDWPHPYPNQDGVELTLADFRGRAVMLSFEQFG
jgi:glucose/arabinose dehydrogenase